MAFLDEIQQTWNRSIIKQSDTFSFSYQSPSYLCAFVIYCAKRSSSSINVELGNFVVSLSIVHVYLQATGQEIPAIITSCTRIINLYGR